MNANQAKLDRMMAIAIARREAKMNSPKAARIQRDNMERQRLARQFGVRP